MMGGPGELDEYKFGKVDSKNTNIVYNQHTILFLGTRYIYVAKPDTKICRKNGNLIFRGDIHTHRMDATVIEGQPSYILGNQLLKRALIRIPDYYPWISVDPNS